MNIQKKQKLVQYLTKQVTAQRLARIENLIPQRTRYVTVVLEDVYQAHNAAAVLRSCEAMGVQDVHCIIKRNEFVVKKNIALGSSKWIDIFQYRQQAESTVIPTMQCITALKKQGYTIVATSPHATMTLEELPLNNKIALLFGTEELGLSDEAFSGADALIKIPMYGFVESFNVSVSVALCLYSLTTRLRASKHDWHLTAQEQEDLKLEWLRNSIEHPDIVEREFLKTIE